MSTYANSPSFIMMKSRFPKRTCMHETQLMPQLAIRGLMWMSRRAKSPYLAHQLSVFSDHRRVNLYLHIWLGWYARMTQGLLVQTERPYI